MSGIHHGGGNRHTPQPESLLLGEPSTPLQDAGQPVLMYSRQSESMPHGGLLVCIICEDNAKVHMCGFNLQFSLLMFVIAQDMLCLKALRCREAVFDHPGFGLGTHQSQKNCRFVTVDTKVKRGKDIKDDSHIIAHDLARFKGLKLPLKQEVIGEASGMLCRPMVRQRCIQPVMYVA